MGRFLSGGGSGGAPRRLSVRLLASNPSVPIPSWARVAYITGCGGGSSGGIGSNAAGEGGGAGAFAIRHPLLIPDGTATLAAEIGAAGAAVIAAVATTGNIGGATIVTVGSTTLRLNGGGNNAAGTAFIGGWPYINGTAFASVAGAPPGTGWMVGTTQGASSLGVGSNGGPNNQSAAWGTGGHSPFGAALMRNTTISGNTAGVDAQGYGAGGTSASTAGSSVTSGAGAPGFLLIEFEEATA